MIMSISAHYILGRSLSVNISNNNDDNSNNNGNNTATINKKNNSIANIHRTHNP